MWVAVYVPRWACLKKKKAFQVINVQGDILDVSKQSEDNFQEKVLTFHLQPNQKPAGYSHHICDTRGLMSVSYHSGCYL